MDQPDKGPPGTRIHGECKHGIPLLEHQTDGRALFSCAMCAQEASDAGEAAARAASSPANPLEAIAALLISKLLGTLAGRELEGVPLEPMHRPFPIGGFAGTLDREGDYYRAPEVLEEMRRARQQRELQRRLHVIRVRIGALSPDRAEHAIAEIEAVIARITPRWATSRPPFG